MKKKPPTEPLSPKSNGYLAWLDEQTPVEIHFRDGSLVATSVAKVGERLAEKKLAKP